MFFSLFGSHFEQETDDADETSDVPVRLEAAKKLALRRRISVPACPSDANWVVQISQTIPSNGGTSEDAYPTTYHLETQK